MQLDLNFVLAAFSLLLFGGFLAFFGFLMFHQQSLEPKEKTGAELIEQHYAAGETIEQPTPYYVAPIPAAPDPLEISANLDRKILVGAGMLFAVFALVGGYFFTIFVVRADANSERWRDKVASQEQLDHLLNFIMFGTDQDWADIVTVRLHSAGAEDGHLPLEPNPPKPEVLTGKALGQRLTLNNPQAACVTCHSFDPNTPSTLPTAPNLGHYGTEGPLNDENKARKAAGDADYLLHWIQNAPSIKPGIPMPAFGTAAGGSLNDDQIKAIIEYLQSLK